MEKFTEIRAQLYANCESDHVGIWEVARAVRFDMGIQDSPQVREVAIELIRSMSGEPGFQVGFPDSNGRDFVPWDLSSAEALERIQRQWRQLDRDPGIGEIAWLTVDSHFAAQPNKVRSTAGARLAQ